MLHPVLTIAPILTIRIRIEFAVTTSTPRFVDQECGGFCALYRRRNRGAAVSMPSTHPTFQSRNYHRKMDVSVEERKIRKGMTRRTFLKAAGIAVIGAPLYATEISRHEISIERHNVHLDRLPDEFRGFRIVQISDFHYAEFTEPYFIRDVVERVNRLNPDLVLFNGDYITEGFFSSQRTNQFAYRCVEILNSVKCPLRYAVLGNHDSTLARPAVTDALKVHNIPLLNNATLRRSHSHDELR